MASGDVNVGCAAPSGITLPSHVLLHRVEHRQEEENVDSDNRLGQHYGGKTKKTKHTFSISGEVLEGGSAGIKALENTGAATAASPRIGRVTVTDDHETQSTFSFEAWYYENTQSGYLSGTSGP